MDSSCDTHEFFLFLISSSIEVYEMINYSFVNCEVIEKLDQVVCIYNLLLQRDPNSLLSPFVKLRDKK